MTFYFLFSVSTLNDPTEEGVRKALREALKHHSADLREFVLDYVRRHPDCDSTCMLLAVSFEGCLDIIPTSADQALFASTPRSSQQQLLFVVRNELPNEEKGNARCLYARMLGVKEEIQKDGKTVCCDMSFLGIHFLSSRHVFPMLHRHSY
jgi:hypothetical protein